jgi:hypothetical protein
MTFFKVLLNQRHEKDGGTWSLIIAATADEAIRISRSQGHEPHPSFTTVRLEVGVKGF